MSDPTNVAKNSAYNDTDQFTFTTEPTTMPREGGKEEDSRTKRNPTLSYGEGTTPPAKANGSAQQPSSSKGPETPITHDDDSGQFNQEHQEAKDSDSLHPWRTIPPALKSLIDYNILHFINKQTPTTSSTQGTTPTEPQPTFDSGWYYNETKGINFSRVCTYDSIFKDFEDYTSNTNSSEKQSPTSSTPGSDAKFREPSYECSSECSTPSNDCPTVKESKSCSSSTATKVNTSNKQSPTSSTQETAPSKQDATFPGPIPNNSFDSMPLPMFALPQELLGLLFKSAKANCSDKEAPSLSTPSTRQSATTADSSKGPSNCNVRVENERGAKTKTVSGKKCHHSYTNNPRTNVSRFDRVPSTKATAIPLTTTKTTVDSCGRKHLVSSLKFAKPTTIRIESCERGRSRSETGSTSQCVVLEMGSPCNVIKNPTSYRNNNNNNPSEPIHLPVTLGSKILSRGVTTVPHSGEVTIEIDVLEADEENSQAPTCRICHDDIDEPLISPCRCKGSIAHVHHSCLSLWLSQDQSRSFVCELCRYRFPVVEERRYTMLESIPVWAQDAHNRERFCSFICVSGFITLINLVVYIIAVIVMRYTSLSTAPDWFIACMLLFLAILYLWNVVQCFKDTIFDHWYQWWQGNMHICLDLEREIGCPLLKDDPGYSNSHGSLPSCNHM